MNFRLTLLFFFILFSCSSPLLITKKNIELYQIVVEDKIGFINQKGKIIIEPQYEICDKNDFRNYCDDFSDGYSYIVIKKDSKYGLINWKGEIILQPTYEYLEAQLFNRPVTYIAKLNNKYGMINSQGDILLPFIFDSEYDLDEEEIFFNSINNQDYFYNPKTKEKIKSEYDNISLVNLSYFDVQKNNKHGLLNRSLETIIEPTYDELGECENGLINVRIEDKWYYFDIKNKVINENKFKFATNFHNGITVMKKEKYGVIDSLGNIIIPFKYEYLSYVGIDHKRNAIFQFSNQENYYSNEAKSGLINIKKDTILQPNYSEIFYMEDIAEVSKGIGKSGVIDLKTNEVLVPLIFDSVDYSFFELNKVYYSDREGNEYFGYLNNRKKIIWAQNLQLLKNKLKKTVANNVYN